MENTLGRKCTSSHFNYTRSGTVIRRFIFYYQCNVDPSNLIAIDFKNKYDFNEACHISKISLRVVRYMHVKRDLRKKRITEYSLHTRKKVLWNVFSDFTISS